MYVCMHVWVDVPQAKMKASSKAIPVAVFGPSRKFFLQATQRFAAAKEHSPDMDYTVIRLMRWLPLSDRKPVKLCCVCIDDGAWRDWRTNFWMARLRTSKVGYSRCFETTCCAGSAVRGTTDRPGYPQSTKLLWSGEGEHGGGYVPTSFTALSPCLKLSSYHCDFRFVWRPGYALTA